MAEKSNVERKKPTRKELIEALYQLTQFCTSGERYQSVNPYCLPAIKQACAILAQEQGIEKLIRTKEGEKSVAYLSWDEGALKRKMDKQQRKG